MHLRARQKFFSLLEEIAAGGRPEARILLFHGQSGAGKTHLVRALRNGSHARGLGYFGYAQMTPDVTHYADYFLRRLVNALEKPYAPDRRGDSALMRLSKRLVEEAGAIDRDTLSVLRETDLEARDLARLISELADDIVASPRYRDEDLDINIVRALLYLQRNDSRIDQRVRQYLSGRKLNEFSQTIVAALDANDGEDRAFEILESLGRLMRITDGAALVFCIDQVEDLRFYDDADERFRRALRDLIQLINRVPSAIVVISCLSDFYEEVRDLVPESYRARIEKSGPILLDEARTIEEAKLIVASRLRVALGDDGLGPDDALALFGETFFRETASFPTRRLLEAAQLRWRELQGEPQEPPAIHVVGGREAGAPGYRELWDAFRRDAEFDVPAQEEELALILANALTLAAQETAGKVAVEIAPVDWIEGLSAFDLTIAHHGAHGGRRYNNRVFLCNKGSQGGALKRQIEKAAAASEGIDPIVVRASDFPQNAKNATAQTLRRFLANGGRRITVALYEWERMMQASEFHARHRRDEGFQEWLKSSGLLSDLPSIEELLRLDMMGISAMGVGVEDGALGAGAPGVGAPAGAAKAPGQAPVPAQAPLPPAPAPPPAPKPPLGPMAGESGGELPAATRAAELAAEPSMTDTAPAASALASVGMGANAQPEPESGDETLARAPVTGLKNATAPPSGPGEAAEAGPPETSSSDWSGDYLATLWGRIIAPLTPVGPRCHDSARTPDRTEQAAGDDRDQVSAEHAPPAGTTSADQVSAESALPAGATSADQAGAQTAPPAGTTSAPAPSPASPRAPSRAPSERESHAAAQAREPHTANEAHGTEAPAQAPDTPPAPAMDTLGNLGDAFAIGRMLDHTEAPVTLSKSILRRHAAMLGGSGSGKTTLALCVVEQLLMSGIPVVLIDRKGDLCSYANPDVWRAEAGEDESRRARREELGSLIDVAIYTPGRTSGRPISITLLPNGIAELPEHEQQQLANVSAAAIADMLHLKNSATHQRQGGILSVALKLLGSHASKEVTLADLIYMLENDDAELIELTQRMDPSGKLRRDLIAQLDSLRHRNWALFEGGGEPLRMEALLGLGPFARPGRTRLSVIYTGFLGDNENVLFWVAQFLSEAHRFCQRNPADDLQAVILFDEADLYIPANARPATSEPLQGLLKRARSAGIGLILATQSPGDLDYRSRDQITSWFIGRVREDTALRKLRAAFASESGLDPARVLPNQTVGEFHLIQEATVKPMKAQRSLIRAEQVPFDRIEQLARETRGQDSAQLKLQF